MVMILRAISALFIAAAAFAAQAEPVGVKPAGAKAGAGDTVLRRMIGQMVLIGFVGDKIEDGGFQTVLHQAEEGKIGGVIYLRRNIRSLRAVGTLNATLQAVSDPPLFVAIDQEGGRIERLTKAIGFVEVPSAASIAETMPPEEAMKLYDGMAVGLAKIGINVNLGPVVDLNINPDNPIIGRLGRSFSAHGDTVSSYAKSFIQAHRSHGVLTSLKHFPGHGSSLADTHKGAADVSQTWSDQELQPYRELIASGDAEMIMSSHVINRNIAGADGTPASLSPATLIGLLRKELRFKGVVISDDLQMGAIAKTMSFDETVRRAVMAGNDVLVFANDKHPDPTIPDRISELLLKEARKNPTILARIQESHLRIIRLKEEIKPAGFAPARPN
jgi:beta-N-acetylhexosaminidase